MGAIAHKIDNRLGFDGEELERFDKLMNSIYSGAYRLSPSSIRRFLLSPRHFVISRVVKEDVSDSAKLGILVEDMVLNEGVSKLVLMDFEERPEKDKTMASNANKAWARAFIEKSGGVDNVVSETVFNKAKKMADAVKADDEAMAIIESATVIQRKIEWSMSGLQILGYIDIDTPNLIVDFKTCPDAHVSKFKWKLTDKDSMYGVQLRSYQIGDGTNKPCAIIAVDSDCNTSVFELSQRSLELADIEIEKAIDGFLRCMEENRWHESYSFWSPKKRFQI